MASAPAEAVSGTADAIVPSPLGAPVVPLQAASVELTTAESITGTEHFEIHIGQADSPPRVVHGGTAVPASGEGIPPVTGSTPLVVAPPTVVPPSADLLVSSAPAKQPLDLRHERLSGTVSKYNPADGWGFVTSNLFVGELFFRLDRVMLEFQGHALQEGEGVEFDAQADDMGRPQAVALKPIIGRKPQECLGQRHRGYVRRFAERWGFLNAAAFDGDLFVHRDNLLPVPEQGQAEGQPLLRAGQAVEFDVALDDRGRCVAKQITTRALLRPCDWIGHRLRGFVRSFQGAWGFINSDRFAGDLFVHRDSLAAPHQGQNVSVGTVVEFDIERDYHRKGMRNRLVARRVAVISGAEGVHGQPVAAALATQPPPPQVYPPMPGAFATMPPQQPYAGMPLDPYGMPPQPGAYPPAYPGAPPYPGQLGAYPPAYPGQPPLYYQDPHLLAQQAALGYPLAYGQPQYQYPPPQPLGAQPPYPGQPLAQPPQYVMPQPQYALPQQPLYGQLPALAPGTAPPLQPLQPQGVVGAQPPLYGQQQAAYGLPPQVPLHPGQQLSVLPQDAQQAAIAAQLPQSQVAPALDGIAAGVQPLPQVAAAPGPGVPGVAEGVAAPQADGSTESSAGLLHITMHDWEPDQPGQLKVTKGMLVNVSYRAAHGWVYAGTVQPAGGNQEPITEGWIPQAVVKRVSLCKVAVDWPAEGGGTLGVLKDEVIAVSREAERGWVYGERVAPRRPDQQADGWLPKKVLDYLTT